MHSRLRLTAVLAVCVLSVSVTPTHAQAPATGAASKRPVSYDAYDSWRSIPGTVLSRDGSTVAYTLLLQDGDGELVVRNLRTGVERRHPRGKDPVLTADGRLVAFTVAPVKAAVDSAKKAGKKDSELPKSGFGVMNVASGDVFVADRVKSFKLPEEGSRSVAYLLESPEKKDDKKAQPGEDKEKENTTKKKEKKKEPGTDLIVRDLASGSSNAIPAVTEYTWSKDGARLAYTTSSDSGNQDGAFVRDAKTGSVTTLLTGKGFYKGIAFDEQGTQVAFVSDRDEHMPEPLVARFKLYHWASVDSEAGVLAGSSTSGMPAGFAVSEHGKVSFARDGSAVFFGIAPVPRPVPPEDAPDPVKVDIWNYKDPYLQPMQKVQAEQEEKRSYAAVVHLATHRFVPLASPEMPDITLTEGAPTLLGSSDVPYRQLISWDGDYNDYYLVNLREGTRKQLLEKAHFDARLSPGGQYVLFFDDQQRDWISVRVSDGARVNLTGKLGATFEEEDWDTPDPPRPYGTGGWLDGDKAVLLYDRYDVWQVQPDGKGARQMTSGMGRAQKLVFRYQKSDPEEKAIPSAKPLLLSATDERTKATGFYRVPPGASAPPEKLVMLDKAVGAFHKAKNADVYVFSLSRFDEFPDLWVSGPGFTDMKKISDANPQQSQFLWGRSELIDYTNADGKPLRAILIKPENFDPSKKYPLLVYIYEQLTGGLHRYVAPAPGTSINVTRYVSHGYLVLMPDIVYQTGYPGESAYKCVIPAVQKVLSMGYVDPARVGIQGHSWGGYQITYLITRTNMFRAVEAGASVSNMGKEAYLFVYNGEKHGLRQRDNQKHWTVHLDEFFDHYLLGAPRPQWMDTPVPYLERGTRDVSGFFKPKVAPSSLTISHKDQ